MISTVLRSAKRPSLRHAVLAIPLLFAACGDVGAPSNDDIQKVVQNYMAGVNQRDSDRSLGLFDGPYDPANLKITNSDCSKKDAGVYLCTVTALSKNGSHTAQLRLKKVDGNWTLVEN